jgi:hypothetical protein
MQDGLKLIGGVIGTLLGGELILTGKTTYWAVGGLIYSVDGLTGGNNGQTLMQGLLYNLGGEYFVLGYNAVGIIVNFKNAYDNIMSVSLILADGQIVKGTYDTVSGILSISGGIDSAKGAADNLDGTTKTINK